MVTANVDPGERTASSYAVSHRPTPSRLPDRLAYRFSKGPTRNQGVRSCRLKTEAKSAALLVSYQQSGFYVSSTLNERRRQSRTVGTPKIHRTDVNPVSHYLPDWIDSAVDRDLRSEKIRHQGGGPMGIGGIGLPKLGTHPLLFHAQLGPEHEED